MNSKSFLFFLLFFPAILWAQSPADSLKHEDGRFTSYHSNGKLMLKGKYKDQLKHGRWQYYSEEGKLTKQEIYRKGKLKWTYHFNEKGKITRIIDKKGKETKKSGCGC